MNYRKALFIFSMTTLFLTLGLIGYVVFYVVYPFKTVDILERPVKILDKEVNAGEDIHYLLKYCRYRENHAHITRQFIDGVVYTTPSIETTNPEGCGEMVVAVPVPSTLMSDTYHMRVLVNIEINKLRVIQKVFETEDFRVIGKDEQHAAEDEQKFDKIGL